MQHPRKAPNPKNQTRRILAVFGTVAFLILAPGTVAGLIPWWISHWTLHPPFLGFALFRAIGVVLIIAGIAVVLEAFARFALQGIGTPAPVFPTRHLVVQGSYRYVRNPMYVAVTTLVFGQALLFGNRHLLVYAIIPWFAAALFVFLYEEPTLRRTFGAEYETYCAHVPRWLPRFTPWQNIPTEGRD
jgi:protein-S-isoprenylcysteine O-methyltransferase Ste14